ncbi:MAG: hypothetical protein ROZ36_19205 [Thermincola sp.]|nr:hypothetical protein [Thermincola sp.]
MTIYSEQKYFFICSMLACPLLGTYNFRHSNIRLSQTYVVVTGDKALPTVYVIFDTFPKCTVTEGVLFEKSMGAVTGILSLARTTVILTPSSPPFQ